MRAAHPIDTHRFNESLRNTAEKTLGNRSLSVAKPVLTDGCWDKVGAFRCQDPTKPHGLTLLFGTHTSSDPLALRERNVLNRIPVVQILRPNQATVDVLVLLRVWPG